MRASKGGFDRGGLSVRNCSWIAPPSSLRCIAISVLAGCSAHRLSDSATSSSAAGAGDGDAGSAQMRHQLRGQAFHQRCALVGACLLHHNQRGNGRKLSTPRKPERSAMMSLRVIACGSRPQNKKNCPPLPIHRAAPAWAKITLSDGSSWMVRGKRIIAQCQSHCASRFCPPLPKAGQSVCRHPMA